MQTRTHSMTVSWRIFSLILVAALAQPVAAAFDDRARLGTYVTAISIFRTQGNVNAVQVGMGSPRQDVNLTLSTQIEYIMAAATTCRSCVENANEFSKDVSSSFSSTGTALEYSYIDPYQAPPSITNLTGVLASDIIYDARQDTRSRPFVLISSNRASNAQTVAGSTLGQAFEAGSSGFFGLGIDTQTPNNSLVVAKQSEDANGYLTIGFDIQPMSTDLQSRAGTLHWGAAPYTAYSGSFNWVTPVSNYSAGWAVPLTQVSVAKKDIDTAGVNAVLDPGYNVIMVPADLAAAIYGKIDGAVQDTAVTNRWNVPCTANMSFSATINGATYSVPDKELVQSRNSKTCWGAIVAWGNDTLPGQERLVVLGTPFMSAVYSVIYYSPGQSFVGIARLPGATKSGANGAGGSGVSSRTALAVGLSVALVSLLFFLAFCYVRVRNSPGSLHLRALRRQHRAALVAAQSVNPYAVIPPFVITPPPFHGMENDRPIVAPPLYLNKRSGEERAVVEEMKAEAVAAHAATSPPPAPPMIHEQLGEPVLVPVGPPLRRHKRRHHKHRRHRSRHEYEHASADIPPDLRGGIGGGRKQPLYQPIKPAGYPGQMPGQSYYGDARPPAMDSGFNMGMGMPPPMPGPPGFAPGYGMDPAMSGMPYMPYPQGMPPGPGPMTLSPGMTPASQPLLAPPQPGQRDAFIDYVGPDGPPAYAEASDFRNPAGRKRGILKRLMGRK